MSKEFCIVCTIQHTEQKWFDSNTFIWVTGIGKKEEIRHSSRGACQTRQMLFIGLTSSSFSNGRGLTKGQHNEESFLHMHQNKRHWQVLGIYHVDRHCTQQMYKYAKIMPSGKASFSSFSTAMFLKVCLWNTSISITWELVRKVSSWDPPYIGRENARGGAIILF